MGNDLQMTAGFARLDITPPMGTYVRGYFRERRVKGVFDPLHVRAVAFGCGEKSAVLLVAELCALSGLSGSRWPEELARRLGLPREAVFLCCTHTHTGPDVTTERSDPEYDAWLLRRLGDAAQMALDERRPVTDVRWTQGEQPGQAFVRRYFMKDGTLVTNPKNASPDIDCPASEGDDSFRLIRILRQDAGEIALVNFQNHPDCIGGELISADWPGSLCATVERECDVRCVFVNGTQGDLNNNNKLLPKVPASHEKAMALGTELGRAVAAVFDQAESTGMTGLNYAMGTVQLRTKRDPSKVPESRRIVELFRAGRTEEIHPTLKMANYLYCEASQLCRLEDGQLDTVTADIQVLAFGGLALAGFPGEPFSEVGKYVRANSPFPATCACCLTGNSLGYFPMESDFALGGYEVYNTPLSAGTTEQMMYLARDLLAEL